MTATEPEEPKPCPFCGGEAETESPPECSPRTSCGHLREFTAAATPLRYFRPNPRRGSRRRNRRSEKCCRSSSRISEKKIFTEKTRPGGSYINRVSYEGAFVIVTDVWGNKTAIPAADVEEVYQPTNDRGW